MELRKCSFLAASSLLQWSIEIIESVEGEIDTAVQWWANADLVGRKESNVVFLLLQLAGKYSDAEPIERRFCTALSDGYVISDDLLPDPVPM